MKHYFVTTEQLYMLKCKEFHFSELPYRDSNTMVIAENWKERLAYSGTEKLANLIRIPEIHSVVEWFLVEFGIWVAVSFANKHQFYFDIKRIGMTSGKEYIYKSDYIYSTPHEAYLASFDYIFLNKII